MSGSVKIPKGEYLFRENDPPDAMYVIKSGKLAITKDKQETEIVLAELGPGAMLGEMAFFDDRPRSASAKAIKDTECIKLPFKALHAQFRNFPEWSKAIMRTVNDHLRKANARIKELEKVNNEEELFPPHQINQLISVLNLVAHKFGKKNDDGSILVPPNRLRTYTIQIFQLPTHKMQKLQDILAMIGLIKAEKLADSSMQYTIINPEQLVEFVDWYNKYLFTNKEERVSILEDELPVLKAVVHFASRLTPDANGVVKLSLTEMQNESMRELNYLVKTEHVGFLEARKLISEKLMEEGGIFTKFKYQDLANLIPFWEIVYRLKRATR